MKRFTATLNINDRYYYYQLLWINCQLHPQK